MFAPKSRFLAYTFLIIFFAMGIMAEADAKTIVIGEVTDTVSIPGTLQNSGLGGQSYWGMSGSDLFPTSTAYNLGIGTTAPTPGSKLHVNGNFITSGTVSFTGVTFAGGGNRMLTVDNAGVLGAAAMPSTSDVFWTGTSTNLVAATGRASLGLGSIALLNAIFSSNISDGTIVNADISNTAAIAASKIENGTYFINAAGTNGQFWKSDGVGAGYWSSESMLGGSGTTNYVAKWSTTTTLANSTIYDNGTNVGFGLTNPATKIDIQGSGATGLTLNTDSASSSDSTRLFLKSGGTTFALMNDDSLFTIRTGATPGSSSGVGRFMMDTSGNIGLGTTAPGTKLDIVGSLRVSSSATFSLLSGTGSRMVTVDASGVLGATTTPASLPAAGSNGNTLRSNGTSWVAVSNLYNDGTNIGIGTTTLGTYKLKVAGDLAANAFIYLSDRRMKENINTIVNPLEKIQALRGVSFTWKENGKKSLGLIAQEVEKVYPELVSEEGGLKSVQYGNLVAPLIEAVKAQQEQIEDLEERISELENK